MKPSEKIIAVVLGCVCFAFSGCDQLNETVFGQPDPNAPTLTPVGPSGNNAENGVLVAVDSDEKSGDGQLDFTVPSSFVMPANAQELSSEIATPTLQNGSSTFESNVFASTPDRVDSRNSFQGTVSEKAEPSHDGKIRIETAHLKFVNDLPIAAQADGLIMQMECEEGDILAANTLMVQIDDRLANSELEVTRKEYQAAVEKAKDDSEIQYSKASHEVAGEEYKIALEIDKKGAGTATELSKKWLEYKRAQLAIVVAEVKNKQDLSAADVSKAKQGAAEVHLQLRKIVAPFEGIVAEKIKERYDWVRAGDVILRLVSMEQMRVQGQVRVSQLSAAPHELVGAPATIDVELFPGRVERIASKVGFVSPVMESSGAYKIWIQIPNQKSNNQWIFREGMPAKIEISTN